MGAEVQLRNLGEAITGNLIASMHRYGRVATGRTIRDIEYIVLGPERLQVLGPEHLIQLDRGRGKTSPSGPYQRYGGMTFKDSLRLWMEAKGIPEGKHKEGGYGPVLWAIVTNIHKHGFPGSPGLLSKPLSDEAIDKALNENLGPLADLYAKQIVDLF